MAARPGGNSQDSRPIREPGRGRTGRPAGAGRRAGRAARAPRRAGPARSRRASTSFSLDSSSRCRTAWFVEEPLLLRVRDRMRFPAVNPSHRRYRTIAPEHPSHPRRAPKRSLSAAVPEPVASAKSPVTPPVFEYPYGPHRPGTLPQPAAGSAGVGPREAPRLTSPATPRRPACPAVDSCTPNRPAFPRRGIDYESAALQRPPVPGGQDADTDPRPAREPRPPGERAGGRQARPVPDGPGERAAVDAAAALPAGAADITPQAARREVLCQVARGLLADEATPEQLDTVSAAPGGRSTAGGTPSASRCSRTPKNASTTRPRRAPTATSE